MLSWINGFIEIEMRTSPMDVIWSPWDNLPRSGVKNVIGLLINEN